MSQGDLFDLPDERGYRPSQHAEAGRLRAEAERIHRRADIEHDDDDRRGDLRVQACNLERQADAIVPVEYSR